jgi:hypothetical protein
MRFRLQTRGFYASTSSDVQKRARQDTEVKDALDGHAQAFRTYEPLFRSSALDYHRRVSI